MTVTLEPRGLVWVNNVNTNSLGSLVSQLCWMLGSMAFTVLACFLMTRVDFYDQVGAIHEGTGLRQMVLISRETMRQLGFALAGALLAAWTGKTIAGVFDNDNKRKANPAYAAVLEAKERAALAAKESAALAKEAVRDAAALRENGHRTTAERDALHGQSPADAATVERSAPKPEEEPQWAQGDPRGGIL